MTLKALIDFPVAITDGTWLVSARRLLRPSRAHCRQKLETSRSGEKTFLTMLPSSIATTCGATVVAILRGITENLSSTSFSLVSTHSMRLARSWREARRSDRDPDEIKRRRRSNFCSVRSNRVSLSKCRISWLNRARTTSLQTALNDPGPGGAAYRLELLTDTFHLKPLQEFRTSLSIPDVRIFLK